ncbi:hypothetical protein SKAU_G00209150 [Synaphobranchus kaupii]|uniref:Uncharacterized protein n=1 Tax=Synaphobranchus kaupii TaxID=118154 RepID=A0A9Q1F8J8_SYNKA|nr:hypothetical protein SKAU_G00209150 [Synaphobranchus kaupii]
MIHSIPERLKLQGIERRASSSVPPGIPSASSLVLLAAYGRRKKRLVGLGLSAFSVAHVRGIPFTGSRKWEILVSFGPGWAGSGGEAKTAALPVIDSTI